jgi:hypothetical protein
MSNTIKYSTNAQTLALKKGNYWIGTGDVGKGPTSSTDYWNGITPPSGGYTIYQNKASNGPSIYVASNDSQLISFTNHIAGTSYTTVNECFNYFNGQSDKMVLNQDMGAIVTNGLQLYLDAGFLPSYPRNGTAWNDLSGNGRNFTLTNGATFSSENGGCIVFDGSNDTCTGPASNTFNIATNGDHTVELIFKNTQPKGGATFKFFSTAVGNPNNRGIFAHTAYLYDWVYDTGGCCNATQRISFNSTTLFDIVLHFFFRRKSDVTPYRSILRGNANAITSLVDSGANSNANYTLGTTNAWIGGGDGEFFKGNIYLFRLYNRALSNEEMLQNYNAQKARFGI